MDNDFAVTELIEIQNAENTPPTSSNITRCRIIGTSMSNIAFPLVRYDTGDIALVEEKDGKRRIVEIEGRTDEYFMLKNGTKLTASLATFLFKEMQNITEAQVVLKKDESINLLIVKGNNYTEADEKNLMELAKKYIAEDIDITITYIERVPRTKAGKFRTVVKE